MKKRLMGHTAYQTEYHVVWVTKYRRPVMNAARRRYLARLLPEILQMTAGCEPVEWNILPNHVHLIVIIPPKYSVSEVVGRLKGMTSSKMRERYPYLARVYWRDNVVWSPGYFVSTIGLPEEMILEYVRNQPSGYSALLAPQNRYQTAESPGLRAGARNWASRSLTS